MSIVRSITSRIATSPNTTFLRRDRTVLRQLFAGAIGLGLSLGAPVWAANIAPQGTAVLGVNDAIDDDAGMPLFNAGVVGNINDGNLSTRVDNFSGGSDLGQAISFVGIVWPATRYDEITNLTLTLATFSDGGWFGVSGFGPGAGGTLSAAFDLIEPTIQVSTNGGTNWTTITATSDYFTALDGHGIGGGANPNPTSVTTAFTPDAPVTQINGIRIVGDNGGNAGADANGFIGVFELQINAGPSPDTDGDGLPDSWETAFGLNVGVNDSTEDPDGDGLTNLQEYNAGTNPRQADTDGDGLNDGAEINTTLTNPLLADTDGDGLSDGDELNVYSTNPLLTDTDGDGLSDGDEVNTYLTNPLAKDSDADSFPDGLEIALGTDPNNPASYPSNAALTGTAIMGVNDAIDTDAGTPRFHAGAGASINDGNAATRVDNWFGDSGTDNGQNVSFVGIVWPSSLSTVVKSLTLTLATFTDGGWFGVSGSGPGAGGTLSAAFDLIEPTIQVSTNGGTTWTTVAATSDYLTALDGHGIGGGANPNPTSVATTFTLTEPAAGINGVRIIGDNGGNAGPDANGFIGVFELEVTAGLANDSDGDGMDDTWETNHGLNVGVNDAADDPDNDGLSNIQEFAANTDPRNPDTDADGLKDGEELRLYNTNPLLADTDSDGLSDGQEVNTTATNPLVADTDGDGLTDGQEINTYSTNPNKADTDGDGFSDGLEIQLGTDPNSATSVPANIAPLGTGILGTRDNVDSGVEIAVFNAGVAGNINDSDLTTRVDTWNGGGTSTASFVGILWNQPVTNPIVQLKLTPAIFFDGGWFGVNGTGPGTGGFLSAATDLVEPAVQVTSDHGTTWTNVAATSDYLTALDGQSLPTVDFGPPTSATATFQVTEPQSGIDGIRLIGTEGGTASAGFLGVFELEVDTSVAPFGVTLENVIVAGGQMRFEFDSKNGANHVVQFKDSLADTTWQTLTTITGDGTRKQVTDNPANAQRFYRVTTE